MSRQVDWQARITHVQGEICRCQILIVTFEKLRAVGWDATRRDEGSILVSAEYAHPWLFEDLIFPTRNFKNFKFCQISVSICVKLFPEPCYDFHSCYYLVAQAGTGG